MTSTSAFDFLKHAWQAMGVQLSPTPTGGAAVHCYVVNNADGSPRWIWPADAGRPDFLRFYHTGTWRSMAYALWVRCLFLLRWRSRVAHQRISFWYVPANSHTADPLQPWALFTGTVGPNRKLVMWHYATGSARAVFSKIVWGPASATIMAQEARALQGIAGLPLTDVQVPAVLNYQPQWLQLSDAAPGMRPAPARFAKLPQAPMRQWLLGNLRQQPLGHSRFFQQLETRMQQLSQLTDDRLPVSLLQRQAQLMSRLRSQHQALVAFGPAHADCTPWNLRMNRRQVAMIDWELMMEEAPALYDLFHYEYQSSILMGNGGYGVIRKRLQRLLQQPEWHSQLVAHQLNASLLEQLYLLHVSVYYVQLYAAQPKWHTQVQWLLQAWNDALGYWLVQHNMEAPRPLLIDDVALFLRKRPHAALKLQPGLVAGLPETSDLDLCLAKADATALQHYLKQHALVAKVVANQRTNMLQLAAYLHDGSTLHIDGIWQFKRKSIDFLDADSVLQTAVDRKAGIRQASNLNDFLYTWLFYLLNNARVPERYRQRFYELPADQQAGLVKYVNEHAGTTTQHLVELLDPTDINKKRVMEWIANRAPNKGVQGKANTVRYAKDSVWVWWKPKGFVITFSGVDGAGKSTVIEATRQRIEKIMRRKVVVLRHRPSLLPILSAWRYGKAAAEAKAASTLPRQGDNKSGLGSLLRFGYYYADYVLGQFYIYIKYVLRGYVVMYDRYYFDFINDSLRSNIRLPKSVTAAGYRLLLKPRLNFFLYASPAEILKRKQELNAETIEALTKQYLHLFSHLKQRYQRSQYLPVHNSNLDHTLQVIFDRIRTAA